MVGFGSSCVVCNHILPGTWAPLLPCPPPPVRLASFSLLHKKVPPVRDGLILLASAFAVSASRPALIMFLWSIILWTGSSLWVRSAPKPSQPNTTQSKVIRHRSHGGRARLWVEVVAAGGRGSGGVGGANAAGGAGARWWWGAGAGGGTRWWWGRWGRNVLSEDGRGQRGGEAVEAVTAKAVSMTGLRCLMVAFACAPSVVRAASLFCFFRLAIRCVLRVLRVLYERGKSAGGRGSADVCAHQADRDIHHHDLGRLDPMFVMSAVQEP